MPFTESNYKNAILLIFNQESGYSYAYGLDIEQDY